MNCVYFQNTNSVVLVARVGRNVDGLDMVLYVDALDVLRNHLQMYPHGTS